MEMQQLRQHHCGDQAAGGMPGLQTEMRISECDLLPAGLRIYGDG